jgi:endogenous inhibitor of DNA gyrase (YacG/DUF329 family)
MNNKIITVKCPTCDKYMYVADGLVYLAPCPECQLRSAWNTEQEGESDEAPE